jgi:RND family efflux transporter MFP subunit
LNLDNAIIRAPINGRITGLKVQKGQFVNNNDPLFEIYDPSKMFVLLKLFERDALSLKIGSKAYITPLFQDSSKSFIGYIDQINPRVDNQGAIDVYVRVFQGQKYYPGTKVKINIPVTQGKVIVVPISALVVKQGRNVVFTEINGIAKWNDVIKGRTFGNFIELSNGIQVGDRVIISNNLILTHNSKVKVIQ